MASGIEKDERLDAAVGALARARSRALAGHPSAGQLADYSLGLHPPEEEDEIQEHLVLCRECAEVVLDLVAFGEAREGAGVAELETEREWRGLAARLESPSRRPPTRLPTWAVAAAGGLAASLVVCAGLVLWGLRLRGELAGAVAPTGDVVIADLFARGSADERASAAPARVVVPATAARVVLLLNLGDLRTFPRYQMELARGNGERLWADDDVPRGEAGAFSLVLPVRDLPDGSYEVEVYGLDGGRRELLAAYPFELVRAPD